MFGKLGWRETNQEEEAGRQWWLHAPPRADTWAIAPKVRDASDGAWMIRCQRIFLLWTEQVPAILVVGSLTGDDGHQKKSPENLTGDPCVMFRNF